MKNVRTPVVVVGLLAIGWWLGSMFKGLGPGGPGTSTKTGTVDSVAVESRDPNASRNEKQRLTDSGPTIVGPAPAGPETLSTTPSTPSSGQREILTVTVDGPGYLVGSDEMPPRAAELAEIVALAKATQGDDQGVHVRIRYKKNAQTGARADLIAQLQESGFKRESIQEMSGYID